MPASSNPTRTLRQSQISSPRRSNRSCFTSPRHLVHFALACRSGFFSLTCRTSPSKLHIAGKLKPVSPHKLYLFSTLFTPSVPPLIKSCRVASSPNGFAPHPTHHTAPPLPPPHFHSCPQHITHQATKSQFSPAHVAQVLRAWHLLTKHLSPYQKQPKLIPLSPSGTYLPDDSLPNTLGTPG